MNYRSLVDLHQDLLAWAPTLGRIDAVAGVPRSGMVAASILAQILNVPLASSTSLERGVVYPAGRRCPAGELRRVLLLDDSAGSGETILCARKGISLEGVQIVTAAVYVTEEAAGRVDRYCQIVTAPRLWQWNVFHNRIALKSACFDIDGLLCRDPTADENDDGPAYEEFIQTVPLLIRPTYPIGAIVTSRLERYRKQTMEWLVRNQIGFGLLVMCRCETAKERRRLKRYAEDKAEFFRSHDHWWVFYESDPAIALQINRLTGKPVYCTRTGEWHP